MVIFHSYVNVYQRVSQIQRSYKENHQPKSAENPWSFPPSIGQTLGVIDLWNNETKTSACWFEGENDGMMWTCWEHLDGFRGTYGYLVLDKPPKLINGAYANFGGGGSKCSVSTLKHCIYIIIYGFNQFLIYFDLHLLTVYMEYIYIIFIHIIVISCQWYIIYI
jgi:hypothetical protein